MLSSLSPTLSLLLLHHPLSQLSTSGRDQVLTWLPPPPPLRRTRRTGRRRSSFPLVPSAVEFGSRESFAPEDGFLAVPTFKNSGPRIAHEKTQPEPGAGVEIAPPGEEVASPLPSQFSTAEFVLIGLVLLLAFWVSNFVTPEFVFGKTSPAKGEENEETMKTGEEGMISDGDGNSSGRGFQNKGSRTRKSRRKSSTKA